MDDVLKKRQEEFKEVCEKYSEITKELHELWEKEREGDKEAEEKREKILMSSEYNYLSQTLSTGPTYDITLDEIEDPGYRDAFGEHPLDHQPLREEYEKGIYGARIGFGGDLYGIVECLAYDYGDFYYKLIPDNSPEKPVYMTMVAPYDKYTKGEGEEERYVSKTTIYYTNNTYATIK